MTHKLINAEQAARRLGSTVEAVERYVKKGLLKPDVPGEPGYFDAKKVQALRDRLKKKRNMARLKWSLLGTLVGAALVAWLASGAGGKADEMT